MNRQSSAAVAAFARWLDPRASLGAAVGWLTLTISLGIGAIAGLWAAHAASAAAIAGQREHLRAVADQVAGELSQGILLRHQALRATSAILGQRLLRGAGADIASTLADLRGAFPELAIVEVFDRSGQVLARAGSSPDGLKGRFIALTSPIRDHQGAEVGVVVAHLDWAWVDAMGRALDPELKQAEGEAWILTDDQGQVQISSVPARVGSHFDDNGYLTVHARAPSSPELSSLGWQVSALQPMAMARRDADATGWHVFLSILALGLAGGACGWPIGRRLTRRITTIADSAEQMLAGKVKQLAIPPGRDESARLGSVLARAFSALEAERDALARLNVDLDQRVAARTREVERLAEEARYAGTVRERLRLARDLHDTLGHSMMAMLAQIRVLKRIAASDPASLPAELEQAEQAAHKGLDEARAAITQMRFNAVRDVGLGTSLREHLQRFGERTGIRTEFSCAPSVADFAEASAEVLFRMIEEGLRNVERHAGASHVRLALEAASAGAPVSLTLADDGRGFDPNDLPAGHFGLVGMREQAALIGARLDIDTMPGAGTRITITLRRVDRDR